MDSDSEETVSNVSDLDQLRKGFGQSDWLILYIQPEDYFSAPIRIDLKPIQAQLWLRSQFRDRTKIKMIYWL